jgi:hypothetical protein
MKIPFLPIAAAARRSLALLALGCLAAATASRAQVVVFDFDQHPVSANANNTTVFLPYSEHGLQLDATKNVVIPGMLNGMYRGVKTFVPWVNAGGSSVYTLTSTNGRRFTVKSLRLHPTFSGDKTVAFTANNQTGNLWLQAGQTGAAPEGTLLTFNSHFQNLYWTATANNEHHISALTVEFQHLLSAPAAITVPEASGSAMVPISLTSPVTVDTPYAYTITAGTATHSADYQNPGGGASPATGAAIIPAGAQTAWISVPLLNDTAAESPETFTVTFSNATPGLLAFAGGGTSVSTVVTIASDDGINQFAAWMAAHGLAGPQALPDADPNGDGIKNIETWLYRLNPAGPAPAAWLDRRAAYHTTAANVPGLRLTVPTPLPSDVRLIFEETTSLAAWSEQTRRSGFGTGSLWTGSGASRVVEAGSLTSRTITLPGSAQRSARAKAYFRMKYELVAGSAE